MISTWTLRKLPSRAVLEDSSRECTGGGCRGRPVRRCCGRHRYFGENRRRRRKRGDFRESFHSVLFLATLGIFAEQTNGVNDRVGFLNFAHGFFQRVAAGIVFPVGNDQQNFFLFDALFEMVERANDGVVKRGTAAGIDAFQSFLELGNAVAEVLVEVEIKVIVEVDDESFVFLDSLF